MQPGTEKMHAKAEAAVVAARRYAERGALDLAFGRSFYAMVHAARAVLNEGGVRVRIHAEIQAALRTHPCLPGEMLAWLDEALRLRAGGDNTAELVAGDVDGWIDRAAAFVAAAGRIVGGAQRTDRGDSTCLS